MPGERPLVRPVALLLANQQFTGGIDGREHICPRRPGIGYDLHVRANRPGKVVEQPGRFFMEIDEVARVHATTVVDGADQRGTAFPREHGHTRKGAEVLGCVAHLSSNLAIDIERLENSARFVGAIKWGRFTERNAVGCVGKHRKHRTGSEHSLLDIIRQKGQSAELGDKHVAPCREPVKRCRSILIQGTLVDDEVGQGHSVPETVGIAQRVLRVACNIQRTRTQLNWHQANVDKQLFHGNLG